MKRMYPIRCRFVACEFLIVTTFSWLATGMFSHAVYADEPNASVSKASEEDEIAELRRRALEAAAFEDGESTTEDLGVTISDLDQIPVLPGGLGVLPPVEFPSENPQTPEKVELGRMLYFDLRLSKDFSMSCATCHDPEKGWADGLPRSTGFGGIELGRHSPTVINTAFNGPQFWDGRAHGLEAQAVGPVMAAGEMNMGSEEVVLERIHEADEYEGRFEAVFGKSPSLQLIGDAIAAFERTVVTTDAPFDRYVLGEKDALSDSEKRGLILFFTKASCTACHSGPNFTDNKFHNLGVKQLGPLTDDVGRYAVTKDEKDRGAFKTPTLRNVSQTAPYMHDGSLATLEEVVDFYNRGGVRQSNRSKLIQPLSLTDQQKADLVAFLRSLTGSLPEITSPPGEFFGTGTLRRAAVADSSVSHNETLPVSNERPISQESQKRSSRPPCFKSGQK